MRTNRTILMTSFASLAILGCGRSDSTITQAGSWEKPKAPVVNNVETLPSGTVIHRDPGGDK